MNEERPFNGSAKADVNLSVRERIAIRQALEDEIDKLKKARFHWLDEDKRRNRIIICTSALEKIRFSLAGDGVGGNNTWNY